MFDGGGEAGEGVGEAAESGGFVCEGGGLEFVLLEFGNEKAVDGVGLVVVGLGDGWVLEGLEAPPFESFFEDGIP